MTTAEEGRTRHVKPTIAAVSVLLIAINLRTAVTSVSPIIKTISAAVHLSNSQTSGLSAIPVLCFGVMAPLAIVFSHRLGITRTLTLSMLLLVVGLGVRVTAGAWVLFAGTVVATTGIALSNVLLPAYVKGECGRWAGPITGAYSASLSGMAAVAAATSPALASSGAGWRGALGAWTLPAAIAAGFLILSTRAHPSAAGRGGGRQPTALGQKRWGWREIWREHVWLNVIIMTSSQSIVYYSLLAWLPSIFEAHNFSTQKAGVLLSVFTVGGLPMSLILPSIAMRLSRQWPLVMFVTGLTAIGLAGLTLSPTHIPFAWVVLLALGQGGIYALVLTFFIIKTHDTGTTAQLSLIAQMTSFLVAAVGPFALGELSDGERSWRLPLVLLLLVLVPQAWGGIKAGLLGPPEIYDAV